MSVATASSMALAPFRNASSSIPQCGRQTGLCERLPLDQRNCLCEQRRTLARGKVEVQLLDGIKREFLAPKVIRELSKRVRARLREVKRPDLAAIKRDLALIETQIVNVADTLASIGGSDALTTRLRQLEAEKAALVLKLTYKPEPVRLVPDIAKHVRSVVKSLEKLPEHPYRDEPLMDKARAALQGLLGNVTVVEESDGVFAHVNMGQVYITHGAEKRT
ncbi:MAG: hypothetical protein WD795_04700 [Woeseia sp.]